MPKRARSKSAGKMRKRKRGRSLRRRRRLRSVLTNKLPLPLKYKCNFRYSMANYEFNVLPAGQVGHLIYKVNSMYDFENVLGGEQPMGYDQLMQLYNKYLVIGYKGHMHMASTTSGKVKVGVYFDTTTTQINDWERIMENGAKYVVLGDTGSGNDIKVLKFKINPNKFLGIPKPQTDDTVKGSVGLDPAKMCYMHIIFQSLDSLADPGIIRFDMNSEFAVVLSDPAILNRS